MVYLGEGATSTGAFHEGINFAAVQRCPLVVIVENNGYAYSTPTSKQSAVRAYVDKADGYGAAGEQVDGNDVLAVYGAARRGVERARGGEGVTLIEVLTYRRRGHAEHDDQRYVPAGEVDRWATGNDPIDRYVAALRENGWIEAAELDAEDRRGDALLDRAVEEAEAGGLPEPETALRDVYGDHDVTAPWTRNSPPDPARV
jgi:pyruvate dehydrogenase E1 component alpha subunit/2-oxoisovalerate dehydrogenase E1 component alpha subunit